MFNLRITLDDREPVEVEADSRDIVAWERLGRADKRPTPRRFGDLDAGLMMTDLAELAWFACEREQLVPDLPDRPTFLTRAVVQPFSPKTDEGDDENEEGDGDLDPGRADR